MPVSNFFWLFLGGLAIASPVRDHLVTERATTCATLHVIVARGTGEAQGEGSFSTVASMITSQVSGSDSVGLVYPASTSPSYEASEEQGVTQLTSDIEAYTKSCPKSKIALIGYSQGGQVVGDTMCGTSSPSFTATSPLPAKYAKHVVAAIIFGDTGNVKGESFDVGTDTTGNGLFPRTSTASCPAFAKKLHSWCNSGDPFCASGNDVYVHLEYVQVDGTAGANYVVSEYNAAHK